MSVMKHLTFTHLHVIKSNQQDAMNATCKVWRPGWILGSECQRGVGGVFGCLALSFDLIWDSLTYYSFLIPHQGWIWRRSNVLLLSLLWLVLATRRG